jgi:hypothetical protein
MRSADQNIPLQKDGRQTDFAESVSLATNTEAHQTFVSAKAKLMDISNWHEYSGEGSAKFCLADNQGRALYRLAEVRDFISIDLPATPGPSAGDGLEWVKIENIVEAGDSDTPEESITMIVRPVPAPDTDDEEVAHFYSSVSTSTFIVARYGTKVSAEAHGRNETPNNKGVNLHDTIRNTALALSARIGLSGMQWQKLVEGLLK